MRRRIGAALAGCALAGGGPAVAPAGAAANQAAEGAQFSGQVALLTTSCPSASASAAIDWGDGTSPSTAQIAISGTQLQISGSHTYAEEGTDSGGVSGSYQCLPGTGPPNQPFSATFMTQVDDAPLHAVGSTLTVLAGQGLNSTVASFGDADPGGAASDYSATVSWGDGTPSSSGTISPAAGGFTVKATHTYAVAGARTASVTISDAGGSQATARTTVQVGAAVGQTLALTPGTRFNGPVATFTPHCLLSTAATNARATISWGDGQTSAAQVLTTNAATEFVFGGSHAYTHPGTYSGVVTGGYVCGSQTNALPPLTFTGVINAVTRVVLRAQGIDITQGILDDNYLLVPSGVTSGFPYRGLGFSPPDFSGDPLPGDSPLIEGGPTVVRFYADARGAPSAGLSGVGAALHGYRNGHPLPGSPILATYGPRSLPDTGEPDPAPVFLPERVSDRNAFTFRLPSSWTSAPGAVKLLATLIPPPPGFTPFCAMSSCGSRLNFTMTGITFVHLPTMRVAPVQIIQPSESALPSPQSVYSRALLTEPGGSGYTVEPYVATLDPTNVIKNPKAYDPKGDMNNGYLQLLENLGNQYAQGNPRPDLISGVNIDQRGVTPCCHSTYDYPAVGFDLVNVNRPLTSVGHELGHDLGRNHADETTATGGCGGQGGPWPPDHQGYMQGIGLDMSVFPYKLLYPGLPSEGSQWYDKMSYCAGADESIAWTSPYGWLHSLSALWLYGKKVGRAPDGLTGQGARASMLVVSGVLDSAGARITSILPAAAALPQPATSSFKLISGDRAGHVLTQTNLFARLTHDDPGATYLDFQATVPAHAVNSLEVTDNGSVLAKRVRPAHSPRVRILSPARRAIVGGRPAVALRWRASEAGNAALTITVEYSSDGGRDWRAIYLGPNRSRTRLPSWYFAGSRNARVRVTASDGFNQTSAVSARFTALGSPPQVLITSPARGFHIAGDARLQLSGAAFDQALRRLQGRRLKWLDGPFSLGSGGTLSAAPLPPGRNVIRLAGRDGSGRIASTAVTVFVSPARLPFLHLRIPARVSGRARHLIISASAASSVTLTIDGHRFHLTRSVKRLTLPIRRGGVALLLELTVTDQGVRVPFAAKVLRFA